MLQQSVRKEEDRRSSPIYTASGAVLELDIAHIDRQHTPPCTASTVGLDMKHNMLRNLRHFLLRHYYAGEIEEILLYATIVDDDL